MTTNLCRLFMNIFNSLFVLTMPYWSHSVSVSSVSSSFRHHLILATNPQCHISSNVIWKWMTFSFRNSQTCLFTTNPIIVAWRSVLLSLDVLVGLRAGHWSTCECRTVGCSSRREGGRESSQHSFKESSRCAASMHCQALLQPPLPGSSRFQSIDIWNHTIHDHPPNSDSDICDACSGNWKWMVSGNILYPLNSQLWHRFSRLYHPCPGAEWHHEWKERFGDFSWQ